MLGIIIVFDYTISYNINMVPNKPGDANITAR